MMKGWKEVKIGDLGQVITGNTPPKKDPSNYGTEYPFIKPTDMDIGRRYVTSWDENYSEKAFKRYRNSYIPPKATGVVTIGTVGDKMFQADRYCFTNQSVNVVIANDKYDDDFIYYLLKINLPKVENANPGTASGRHHVSKSNFCAIKVNVPESKETQRKIASILSAYDDLIENNLKRIKLLEEQAQQTYEEWFVRFKFPGYETADFDVDSGLPLGWEEKKIMDIDISMIDGDRGKNYPKQTDFFDEEFCLFLNTGNVTSSGLDFKSLKFITREKDLLLRKGKLIANDVIITTRGTIGNVAYYRKDIPYKNVRINSGMLILRSNSKNILPNYIYQVFISRLFQKQVRLFSYGAAQPQLPVGTLKNIKIIIPDFKNQNKFANHVEYILSSCNNLRNQNQLLKEARDILLPRLMSGMIDVGSLEVKEGFVVEDVKPTDL